jgi:hypothetical protein
MAEAYRVFVVLDRDYGERLLELARSGPVWIVDTPQNRAAAQNLWAVNPNRNHLDGVTTFKAGQDCSNEETLINELDTIDLHHGSYSADPPYTVLEVIGARLSDKLENELSRFGFNQFRATTEGFGAVRPVPRSWDLFRLRIRRWLYVLSIGQKTRPASRCSLLTNGSEGCTPARGTTTLCS